MVIAKSEWFKSKKTDSFKIIGYPWQSTACILSIFLLAIIVILPENLLTKTIIMELFYFLFIDSLIAYQKSLDERQMIHHAIVHRNAFLGMVIITTLIQLIPLNYNLNLDNILNLIELLLVSGCLIAIITYYQLNKGKLKIKILHKIASNINIIAKSEWFKRKNKSNYWILDISWKGTAFILLLLLLDIPLAYIYYIQGSIMIQIIATLLFIFLIIIYLIAFTNSFDERQRLNYAITYRNAFWGMIISFILIQPIIQPILSNYNLNSFDIFTLFTLPLFIGVLIAVVTYYKLQRELLFL